MADRKRQFLVRGYVVEMAAADDGTILITCPDLPEIKTTAKTPAEALYRAEEAVDAAVSDRIVRGEPII